MRHWSLQVKRRSRNTVLNIVVFCLIIILPPLTSFTNHNFTTSIFSVICSYVPHSHRCWDCRYTINWIGKVGKMPSSFCLLFEEKIWQPIGPIMDLERVYYHVSGILRWFCSQLYSYLTCRHFMATIALLDYPFGQMFQQCWGAVPVKFQRNWSSQSSQSSRSRVAVELQSRLMWWCKAIISQCRRVALYCVIICRFNEQTFTYPATGMHIAVRGDFTSRKTSMDADVWHVSWRSLQSFLVL